MRPTITVDTFVDEVIDDNNCSLREAITSAETDTAVDNCAAGNGWDIIQLSTGTYAMSTTVDYDFDIYTHITIKGNGETNTFIDGVNTHRIFDVDAPASLTLENLAIINGFDDGRAGCMYIRESALTLLNSTVSNCTAVQPGSGEAEGGAIYNYSGNIWLFDSRIENSFTDGDGGAIENDYGIVYIENSDIISNSAESGGAFGGYEGAITRIHNSRIISNTALTDSRSAGGAINHTYGILILESNSEVSLNKSRWQGGGIYVGYGAFLFEDSIISNNQISNTSFIRGGGGVYAPDGAWLRNVTISENETAGTGGGYYGDGLIQDSTIYSNTATDEGGGLTFLGILENSQVEHNEAGLAGGGLFADGTHVISSSISHNLVISGNGAGIYVNGEAAMGGLVLMETAVSQNVGASNATGGGIYTQMPVNLLNSTISGNSVEDTGGGIYNDNAVVALLNSTVSGNTSNVDAGGIENNQGSLSLNFSSIANNTTGDAGGGLYNNGYAAIENSILAGNSGGGISEENADCYAGSPIAYGGHSLFGDGTGCAATGQNDITVVPADIFTTVIAPLADNGGSTEAHNLLSSSPAIDAGNSLFCPDSDQRGYNRPIGTTCDIGAVELLKMIFLPVIMK